MVSARGARRLGLLALAATLAGCSLMFDTDPLPIGDAATADALGDAPQADAAGDAPVTPVARITKPGTSQGCTLNFAPPPPAGCPTTACGGAPGWEITFDASASAGLVGEQAAWTFALSGSDFSVTPAEATGVRPTVIVQFAQQQPLVCLGNTPQPTHVDLTASLVINGGADETAALVRLNGVADAACPVTTCEPQ